MKKLSFRVSGLVSAVVFALAATTPLYAFNGCVDSPENPTAILGVAGAACVLFTQLRNRIKK